MSIIHRDLSSPELLERTLRRYDEALLRPVAGRLIRPRNHWPLDELIKRCLETLQDVTTIDRRLKELEPAERQLLALVGHSRQLMWDLGNLVELTMSLGQTDGLAPILGLLSAGLFYPAPGEDEPGRNGLRSFEYWVASGSAEGRRVLAHPLAVQRALGEPLPFDDAPAPVTASTPVLEADGLDWPLRLAVLWQQVAAAPLRRTQQGDFFKRDHDRLSADPLLNAASAEGLPTVPDAPFLGVGLGLQLGMLVESDGELRADKVPPSWSEGLAATLAELFQALPRVRGWEPLDGCTDRSVPGTPFPSAGLLTLALLGRLAPEQWGSPTALWEWIQQKHPYWREEDLRPSRRRDWVSNYLLGLCYQLRLVQAARTAEGEWAVRLSPLGRWLLGLGPAPSAEPEFPRTLLVQPNLEIVAYRQGLTPALIDFLARCATFQSLGSVCTLQLGPESVYRALESGLTFESILQTLEQRGSRATPPAVVDSLRTWSDKRERLTIYPSASLLEFSTKEDLDDALRRGFPGVRLSDRLAVVASEASIDYSLFRLISSRDYAARPEQCVEVDDDGVTLTVDLTRSDLLLESELSRFAEQVGKGGKNARIQYRLTPQSLRQARAGGLTAEGLQTWFQQRAGEPASAAALMLLGGGQGAAPHLRRHIVLQVADEQFADGLVQWPATRELIDKRLGPTVVSVAEEKVAELRRVLAELGVPLLEGASEQQV